MFASLSADHEGDAMTDGGKIWLAGQPITFSVISLAGVFIQLYTILRVMIRLVVLAQSELREIIISPITALQSVTVILGLAQIKYLDYWQMVHHIICSTNQPLTLFGLEMMKLSFVFWNENSKWFGSKASTKSFPTNSKQWLLWCYRRDPKENDIKNLSDNYNCVLLGQYNDRNVNDNKYFFRAQPSQDPSLGSIVIVRAVHFCSLYSRQY